MGWEAGENDWDWRKKERSALSPAPANRAAADLEGPKGPPPSRSGNETLTMHEGRVRTPRVERRY